MKLRHIYESAEHPGWHKIDPGLREKFICESGIYNVLSLPSKSTGPVQSQSQFLLLSTAHSFLTILFIFHFLKDFYYLRAAKEDHVRGGAEGKNLPADSPLSSEQQETPSLHKIMI